MPDGADGPLRAAPAAGTVTTMNPGYPPPVDPIIGEWDVTYGSRTVAAATGSPEGYSFTARGSVKPTGARCRIPAGTLLCQLSWAGGSTYVGWHGLWWIHTCRFSHWSPVTLQLDTTGRVLSGFCPEPNEWLTFRRRGPVPTPR